MTEPLNPIAEKAPQKVLICTNHLLQWAGSEVVTLELSEEFCRRGMDVTVLCNDFSGPVEQEFVKAGARLSQKPDEHDFFAYDLVYSQHHLLPIVLQNSLKKNADAKGWLRFPVTVYNHLSPYEPYEAPGPFIEREISDIILANSPETAKSLATYGAPFETAQVLANPAPSYFDAGDDPCPSDLKRLLVVSNHVPVELRQALNLLEKRGLEITRIGKEYKQVRVTPSLLAAHDAVVTIGKTVQYALRARRPVFCYDRFAGPGWISAENFQGAALQNFSGRGFGGPRTPEALASDVVDGFAQARNFFATMRDDDLGDFQLEVAIDSLLDQARALLSDKARLSSRQQLFANDGFLRNLAHEAQLSKIARSEFLKAKFFERKLKNYHESFAGRIVRKFYKP